MDFSTAKNEVAERAQDTSTAHKTRCGEWLNLTKDEICTACDSWDWLQKTDDLAVTAGDQEYALTDIASDIVSIFDMRSESDGGWKLVGYTPSDHDAVYPDPDLESGRPELYTIWNDTIIFNRSPDTSYTLQVRYYRTVANLSLDDDTFPWPSRWDWLVLEGAMRYAYDYNDDSRVAKAEARFERGLRRMLAHKSRYKPTIVIRPASGARFRRGSPWPVHRFAY